MLQWRWGCIHLINSVFFISLDKFLEVELLDDKVVLFLVFWRSSIMFSIVVAPICNPPKIHKCTFFSISLLTLVCWFIDDSHSDRCLVICHCGFNLHFPDDFHMFLGHLYILFGEMSIQVICPILMGVFVFLMVVYEFLIYFGY